MLLNASRVTAELQTIGLAREAKALDAFYEHHNGLAELADERLSDGGRLAVWAAKVNGAETVAVVTARKGASGAYGVEDVPIAVYAADPAGLGRAGRRGRA